MGAIQPGFYADLTIVDRDLLATKPEDILQTVVLGTVVGGRFTYVAEDRNDPACRDHLKSGKKNSGIRRQMKIPHVV